MSTSGEQNRERSESIRPKYFGMGRGLHATVVPHCGIGLDGFAEIVDDGAQVAAFDRDGPVRFLRILLINVVELK